MATTDIVLRESVPAETGGGLWLRGDTKTASEAYAQKLVLADQADYVEPRLPLTAPQAAASIRARRPQIVGNNGQMPTNARAGTAGSRTDQMMDSRCPIWIGPADVSDLQFAYCGFKVLNTGNGESNIGNDYGISAAVELLSPVTYQQQFISGALAGTVADGNPLVLTSASTGYDFAAGTKIYARSEATIASTANSYPGGFQTTNTGFVAPSGTTSQVGATGAMTVPGGALTYATGLMPYATIGVPAQPMVAVIPYGDSIPNGQGDLVADAYNSKGFIQRGLNIASPAGPIPWAMQASPSDLLSMNLLTNGNKKRALWKYATHIIFCIGTNDVNAGTSLATIQGYYLALWAAAKRVIGPYGAPLKVTQVKLLPRTGGAWDTAAAQTSYATGFAPGGVRDQLNAWFDTQLDAGVIDYIINPNTICEDPANPGKWVTNGSANYSTQDGVHPYTTMTALMVPTVTAVVSTFTP